MSRSASLPVPGCEGVSQVMPAEILISDYLVQQRCWRRYKTALRWLGDMLAGMSCHVDLEIYRIHMPG